MHAFHKCSILLLMGYLLNVQSFQVKTSIVHRYSRNCKANLRKSSPPTASDGQDDKDRTLIPGLNNVFGRNIDKSGEQKSYETYGKLAGFAQLIDVRTGGWGLGYADTRPFNDRTIIGVLFLATNAFYIWAGIDLFTNKNYLLSASVEIAGLVSLYYHWSQVHFGPNRDEVRYSLLIDYITAFITINLTFIEIIALLIKFSNNAACDLSLSSVLFGVTGVACLFGSWIFEFGLPYIFFHGLWHIFSSLSVADVGAQLNTICS